MSVLLSFNVTETACVPPFISLYVSLRVFTSFSLSVSVCLLIRNSSVSQPLFNRYIALNCPFSVVSLLVRLYQSLRLSACISCHMSAYASILVLVSSHRLHGCIFVFRPISSVRLSVQMSPCISLSISLSGFNLCRCSTDICCSSSLRDFTSICDARYSSIHSSIHSFVRSFIQRRSSTNEESFRVFVRVHSASPIKRWCKSRGRL